MGHAVQALSTGTYGEKLDVERLSAAVEKPASPLSMTGIHL